MSFQAQRTLYTQSCDYLCHLYVSEVATEVDTRRSSTKLLATKSSKTVENHFCLYFRKYCRIKEENRYPASFLENLFFRGTSLRFGFWILKVSSEEVTEDVWWIFVNLWSDSWKLHQYRNCRLKSNIQNQIHWAPFTDLLESYCKLQLPVYLFINSLASSFYNKETKVQKYEEKINWVLSIS